MGDDNEGRFGRWNGQQSSIIYIIGRGFAQGLHVHGMRIPRGLHEWSKYEITIMQYIKPSS